jgi:sec-independent protein translocase protein TatA
VLPAAPADRPEEEALGLENPLHIAIILLVVLMVFGAKRLPDMGRSLGQGMREFKDGITGKTPPELLSGGTPGSEESK